MAQGYKANGDNLGIPVRYSLKLSYVESARQNLLDEAISEAILISTHIIHFHNEISECP